MPEFIELVTVDGHRVTININSIMSIIETKNGKRAQMVFSVGYKNDYYYEFPDYDEVIEKIRICLEKSSKQDPVDDRVYTIVYVDSEPSEIAEKIYNICDEEELSEVCEYLCEYKEANKCLN